MSFPENIEDHIHALEGIRLSKKTQSTAVSLMPVLIRETRSHLCISATVRAAGAAIPIKSG